MSKCTFLFMRIREKPWRLEKKINRFLPQAVSSIRVGTIGTSLFSSLNPFFQDNEGVPNAVELSALPLSKVTHAWKLLKSKMVM